MRINIVLTHVTVPKIPAPSSRAIDISLLEPFSWQIYARSRETHIWRLSKEPSVRRLGNNGTVPSYIGEYRKAYYTELIF